ncbi:MAG: ATP-binding protein [bacterium]|nr:ATP-binding protein [bacterium]
MSILVGISFELVGLGFVVLALWQSQKLHKVLRKKDEEVSRKMYELAILKELGDRIGYSLDVQQIIDIITGSLRQFIDYSVVSYMFLEPEKILFRVDLEKSVNRKFVDEMKERMLKSLAALLDQDLKRMTLEEVLTGAIIVEDFQEPVGSFFNIPLVIAGKVVGILTVAHTKPGLYKEEEMSIIYKITGQASQAVTRLQEVVQNEQRKLNAMVESMEDGVLMTDKDYRVLVANPAVKRVMGLEDKADLTIFDFIDNLGGRVDIRGKLEESVKLNKVWESEDIMIGERFFQIFVLPVKAAEGGKAGEVLGSVAIFHDITREKEIQKSREDFSSMMVHELRSPMDGIKKIAMAMSKWDEEKSKKMTNKYAQMIHDSSSNILELVSDLLDVAKLEAGKFDLKKIPGDLKEAVAARLNFFKPSAQAAKIELESWFDADLPALVSFDAARISQVLNNLLSNALKFTSAGGTITIKAFLHHKDQDIFAEAQKSGSALKLNPEDKKLQNLPDTVVVAIVDTGVGISKENSDLLFSKFKQLNSSAIIQENRGTGLGLVITKGIVEEHGGIIGVASEEGEGSTFYFTLPL